MSTAISWSPRYSVMIALEEDGESQKELAARLGWTPSKLSRMLSGSQKGNLNDWLQIAKAQGRDITFYVAPTIQAMGVYLGSLIPRAA